MSLELSYKLLKYVHFLVNFRFLLLEAALNFQFSTRVRKISNWVMPSAFICIEKYFHKKIRK